MGKHLGIDFHRAQLLMPIWERETERTMTLNGGGECDGNRERHTKTERGREADTGIGPFRKAENKRETSSETMMLCLAL